MSDEAIRKLSEAQLKKDLPDIKSGQTVRVSQKIKEGDKERVQVFEGIVIGHQGGTSINATLTVRKVSEGVGVEKIFPLHSPTIEDIEVIKTAKVRRSKLYHLRDKDIKMKEDTERHEKHLKKVADIEAKREKEAEAKAKEDAEAKVKEEVEDKKKAAADDKAKEDKKEEKSEDKPAEE